MNNTATDPNNTKPNDSHFDYHASSLLHQLTIKNKTYQLPIYLPDATLGVVRNLDSQDLNRVQIEGVVINTYHLRRQPGVEILQKIGGIKNLMSFSGLTASDSGGFQLFSLINKDPKLGKITDKGVVLYTGKNQQKKQLFTPEESIRVQFAINSDIMICLDDFTPDDADEERIQLSIDRTVEWARRCKIEFEKQLKKHGFTDNNRPLLFAPIQGHRHHQLRKQCADKLLEIGFDGYGLGGWPFDDQGNFDYEMCAVNASLTPDNLPRFALGIGKPDNITRLHQMGYHIFDCVLPTRDARHQRLYVWKKNPAEVDFSEINLSRDDDWYDYLYISRGSCKTDQKPVSQFCDCPTCQNYSRAYLNHLFKAKDGTAFKLAEMHNLRFYTQVMEKLRETTRVVAE